MIEHISALAVPPERLHHHLDPGSLSFATTADIEPSRETIGQPRATGAISFGLEINSPGYNVYAAGEPGSGRESTIVDFLQRVAPDMGRPDDWVYTFNFADPDRPRVLRLPPGHGNRLAQDVEETVAAVHREIVRAFESEEYDRQKRGLLDIVGQQRNRLFERLGTFARERGFLLEMTPSGILSVPFIDGKPMQPEQFAELPEDVKAGIEAAGKDVQKEIASTMRQVRLLDKDAAGQMATLDLDVTLFAIDPVFADIREQYQHIEGVVHFIEQLREDVTAHYREFLMMPPPEAVAQQPANPEVTHVTARYEINVIIDNGDKNGAPVIIERHPTYYNLLGRINYRMTPGMMVTDHRQIKPGALHRANGGFLVLHASEVLGQPFAWEALKRSLLCREIRIENMGEQYSAVPAATLRPEPIPMDVKVVMIGSRDVYRLLYAMDEEFEELFKVKAEFSPDMPWTEENVGQYLAFVSRYVRDNNLRHLDVQAAARIIEYGARLQNHQQKLSTRLINIANILTEASHWAGKAGREVVGAGDIDLAIRQKEYRSNLIEERHQALIDEGVVDIDTSGQRVGQVNGVAVLDLGDYAFGRPSRISARVAVGGGKIESIDHAIKLSGPIHSKGFMILTGYLSGQYARTVPLAFDAKLAFEQSYNEVDGDSASSAELYALLSALSGVPLRQNIAVTGAVDQYGNIRAVGGVTTKVEGFFAVCVARGLDSSHGVIIPRANVPNLMLADEIVEAVRDGTFTIWAIDSIDQGIEVLTGVPAGVRQADGTYPPDSIHGQIEASLQRFAESARAFAASSNGMTDRQPVEPLLSQPD